MLWLITAALRTINRTKFRSRGTSLLGVSNRVFQLDCRLCQSTVTNVEYFKFFPVCFAEILTAPFSDDVVV